LEIAHSELGYSSHLKSMRKHPFKSESLGFLYLPVGDLSGVAITGGQAQCHAIRLEKASADDRVRGPIDKG